MERGCGKREQMQIHLTTSLKGHPPRRVAQSPLTSTALSRALLWLSRPDRKASLACRSLQDSGCPPTPVGHLLSADSKDRPQGPSTSYSDVLLSQAR
jgi:hypothetical protein